MNINWFKRTWFMPTAFMLLACSMDANYPVFLPIDGDYIGQKLKLDSSEETGELPSAYLEVSTESDGSYMLSAEKIGDGDPGRMVFKAVRQVDDGIIYAVQTVRNEDVISGAYPTKARYEIYPVRIKNDGTVIPMQFLSDKKSKHMARHRHISIENSTFTIGIVGKFNRSDAQCLVQDLILTGHYKLLNDKKPVFTKLIKYIPPKVIGISDCK